MESPRYTSVAVALHWAIAILIVGQVAVGLYMHKLPNISPIKFDLYQLHKSSGLTILALTFVRLGWRFSHRPPALPGDMPSWQKLVARATHWAFYALIFLTPLAGWAMVSASPTDIPTKWFGLAGVPHLPFFDGVANRKGVEDILKEVHEYLAFAILGLLALHVGAALKHQFFNRDGVLQSMMPRSRGQWASIAVILGALGAASGFYLFGPAPQASAAFEPTIQTENVGANWTVDYDASRLVFIGEEKGRRFEGAFEQFTAGISFDPDNLTTSSIEVEVPTASAATGDDLRDASLPGAEWFGVREFPAARFITTDIHSLGGNAYEAVGTLTIKDIGLEIMLPFTLDITGDNAIAAGGVDLVRTDFDLGAASSWLDEENVALNVRVEFEILAVRKN